MTKTLERSGLLDMVKILNIVRKLPMFGPDGAVALSTFSTCRVEGFVIRHLTKDICVAWSESRGSDQIRVLFGTDKDFRGEIGDSHGFHSYGGPDSDEVFDNKIMFDNGKFGQAAKSIISLLHGAKPPKSRRKAGNWYKGGEVSSYLWARHLRAYDIVDTYSI